MPIYDFECRQCGHKFTLLTGVSERDKATCPACGSSDLRQLISGCAVKVSGGSGSGSAGGGCGGGHAGHGGG
ncbi:FmdB family zinc ribbon protein [Desulfotomaculum copahuensis]|uniref:FmdB family transcriptional regulator n=1 Tax=Desulfotomaculum copahuensis TaxID=1838280 RepID=A0A1B7LEB1_9FIRM|nr:zinc ribbon domain-containing protein [Desulfotomaculum copahuensis]OAT81439.1 FmdB family transcriptional regulator [Desulfotomaculum copahuensis]